MQNAGNQYPMASLTGLQQAGQQFGAAPGVVPPKTLASALASLESLNVRLQELSQNATRLAQLIGGPYPTAQPPKADYADRPAAAIERLYDDIGIAHQSVSEVTEAIAATRRSLGE